MTSAMQYILIEEAIILVNSISYVSKGINGLAILHMNNGDIIKTTLQFEDIHSDPQGVFNQFKQELL